jgi:hypothetical protein
MRKRLWTISGYLLAIGIPLLFFLLPYKIQHMPEQTVNIGFGIAGLFIVSPIIIVILVPLGIWNKVKRLRLQSPVFLIPIIDKMSVSKVKHSKEEEKELEKYKLRLAPLERHVINVEGAFSAGDVNYWLDYRFVDAYWCGLKEQFYPYIVIQVDVISRFIFDLMFAEIKQLDFVLTMEEKKIADKAMLVERQQQWNNPEESIEFRRIPHIQSLNHNILFFRFGISAYARDYIVADYEGRSEIQLKLFPNWKLKTASYDKEITFSGQLTTKCRTAWTSDS